MTESIYQGFSTGTLWALLFKQYRCGVIAFFTISMEIIT
jgi:hypothetical protein